MTDEECWGVIVVEGVPHIVPIRGDTPIESHIPSWDCPCKPQAYREGPLDDPICNHQEPSWPGANRGLVQ